MSSDWTRKFITLMATEGKVPASHSRLFDELIYGKKVQSVSQLVPLHDIYVYINERNIQILTVFDTLKDQLLFDIRSTQIFRNHHMEEIRCELPADTYLVLRQEEDEVILAFESQLERDKFEQFLKFFAVKLRNAPMSLDSVTLKHFIAADVNHNLTLSTEEMLKVLQRLKVSSQHPNIKNIVSYVRQDSGIDENEINYRDFERIIKIASSHVQLLSVFEKYGGCKIRSYGNYLQQVMSEESFGQFLTKEQQMQSEKVRKQAVKAVFGNQAAISFYDFSRYLFSEENTVYDSRMLNKLPSTEYPLNKYFCRSSHINVLQIKKGGLRLGQYLEELEAGVRCVSIDVSQDLKENVPIIAPAVGKSKAVTFRGLIEVISIFLNKQSDKLEEKGVKKQKAGKQKQLTMEGLAPADNRKVRVNNTMGSHSPLILSIKMHCSRQMQRKMADILQDELGSRILRIDKQHKEFPKLKECLGKVIIKLKAPCSCCRGQTIVEEPEEGEDISSEDDNPKLLSGTQNKRDYPHHFSTSRTQFYQRIEELNEEKWKFDKCRKVIKESIQKSFRNLPSLKNHVDQSLLSLVSIYGCGKLNRSCPFECFSLTPQKLMKYQESAAEALENFGNTGWIHIYPSDRAEFCPTVAIQEKVQLIAMDLQRADHRTCLMEQFFLKGSKGMIGYRLIDTMEPRQEKQFSLRPVSVMRVIYNSNVAKQNIPPVQVLMRFQGSKIDMAANSEAVIMKAYTQTVTENAYNPYFSLTETLTLKILDPQLAFVLVEIQDCGIAAIPLETARIGYRCVALYDRENRQKESKILFEIGII